MCGFRLQPEGCVKRSDEFSAATAFRLKAEATAGSAARGTSHSTLHVARDRTLHRRTWHVARGTYRHANSPVHPRRKCGASWKCNRTICLGWKARRCGNAPGRRDFTLIPATAACHGAFGAEPPAAAQYDDTTTRRHDALRNNWGHGRNTQHRCEFRNLRQPCDETMSLLSTALPRCRRAGRPAGVAGVRVERIGSGQSEAHEAVCDPFNSHSCRRAKRGAASGQNPSSDQHVVSSCRRVVAASVPIASAAFVTGGCPAK